MPAIPTIRHEINDGSSQIWISPPLSIIPFHYLAGIDPPNYPMPATMDNADIAGNWLFLHYCPFTATEDMPCNICIEKFEEGIELAFLFNAGT